MPSRLGQKQEDHCLTVLETMPTDPQSVAAWFGTMKESQFDSVCSSAIAFTLNSILEEGGFISVRDVVTMTNAMRDRYHAMLKDARVTAAAHSDFGERSPRASINEWQARILYRLPRNTAKAKKFTSASAYAKLFGCKTDVVQGIWQGKTWKHLSRRAA